MGNICTLIFTTNKTVEEIESLVQDIPEVKRYGSHNVRALTISPEGYSNEARFGNMLVYSINTVRATADVLIKKGVNPENIYWQDLDGFGPVVFKFKPSNTD